MGVEEIQTQPCKFSRVGNGRNDTSTKIAHPDDDEDGELKRPNPNLTGTGAPGDVPGANRLRGWHQSSRIIRVSRATGGKDRHSKVLTSKGLRDRRVRLSVTTAIQFYDLQDRLGYDQPSKAVEWLIKAASDAIAELPSLNGTFPDTPKQLSDEKRGGASDGAEQGFDSADMELEDPNSFNHNQSQHLSLSKSACSSTSETSKGSGLSLSRSNMRVKARERARERAAKEKEKESNMNMNPISQNSTFTELLTGGIGSVSNNSNNNTNNNTTNNASSTSPSGSEANLFHKAAAARQWPLTPMDYFSTGLLGPTSSRTTNHTSGFSGQIQLGSSIPTGMTMSMSIPPFINVSGESHHHHHQHHNHHQHQHHHNQEQLQHFPFISDHLISVATTTTTAQQPAAAADYNLNFTISPGLAGFNRGTLQSNSSSPSLLPHLQRFTSSSTIDGSTNVPFFIGAAAPPHPPSMDNHHHHHHHQFPPELQLCYDDGSRHSDHKGKGKN